MNIFKQPDEPAVESYFYWKGRWLDELKATCRETWKLNQQEFQRSRSLIADAIEDARFSKIQWFKVIFRVMVAAAVFLGTFIWTPLLLLLAVTVAGCLCLAYVSIALLLMGGEYLFLKIHGLFKLCPHCHERVSLPVYECPQCHARHMNLVPSPRYGLFYRRCASSGCGAKIPVTRITGRKTLHAFCRKCNRPLEQVDYVPMTLAFMGGPSVGKTMIFHSLAAKVLPEVSSTMGLSTVVNNNEEKDKLNRMEAWIQNGEFPQATQNRAIDAFCVDLVRNTGGYPYRLYLYDPPGESFRSTNDLRVHTYYNHLKSVIWVFDPFTLERIRSEFDGEQKLLEGVKVGAMSPERCLELWLIGLKKEFSGVLKGLNCAVAINKTDVLALASLTGLKAGDDDAACREFLDRYGCAGFINTLERTFSHVRFFAVSAVGQSASGRAFQPIGLDGVMKWVLGQMLA